MEYTIVNGELYHYGVKGMKWGVRKIRGHAGPGIYLTRKRQLAGDKKDLEYLNKGGHLSIGLTKKRQAAYDAKDRARLESRIARNEAKLSNKSKSGTPSQLEYSKSDSAITKKAKLDYNSMSDSEFMKKYQVSKKTYAKRVAKYGDPYANAPLAKFGKQLSERSKKKAADNYVKSLEKTLKKDVDKDLDQPYKQEIGPGVYANWPSKRKFIEAEINRMTRKM